MIGKYIKFIVVSGALILPLNLKAMTECPRSFASDDSLGDALRRWAVSGAQTRLIALPGPSTTFVTTESLLATSLTKEERKIQQDIFNRANSYSKLDRKQDEIMIGIATIKGENKPIGFQVTSRSESEIRGTDIGKALTGAIESEKLGLVQTLKLYHNHPSQNSQELSLSDDDKNLVVAITHFLVGHTSSGDEEKGEVTVSIVAFPNEKSPSVFARASYNKRRQRQLRMAGNESWKTPSFPSARSNGDADFEKSELHGLLETKPFVSEKLFTSGWLGYNFEPVQQLDEAEKNSMRKLAFQELSRAQVAGDLALQRAILGFIAKISASVLAADKERIDQFMKNDIVGISVTYPLRYDVSIEESSVREKIKSMPENELPLALLGIEIDALIKAEVIFDNKYDVGAMTIPAFLAFHRSVFEGKVATLASFPGRQVPSGLDPLYILNSILIQLHKQKRLADELYFSTLNNSEEAIINWAKSELQNGIDLGDNEHLIFEGFLFLMSQHVSDLEWRREMKDLPAKRREFIANQLIDFYQWSAEFQVDESRIFFLSKIDDLVEKERSFDGSDIEKLTDEEIRIIKSKIE